MAHSSAITDMKHEAVKRLLKCKMFVDALDAKEIEDIDKLVGTHIFTHPINPEYLENPCTFLVITTYIPRFSRNSNNSLYLHPKLIFNIVSHVDHMKISPKEFKTNNNRNDFISQIIDHLFNLSDTSKKKFGYFGQLELLRNDEGYINKDWVYRVMEFETMDFDRALCECKTKEFFAKYGYEAPD